MRLAFSGYGLIFPIMNGRRALGVALSLGCAWGWGCEAFEDPTPENIFLTMIGSSGADVRVVYTTEFLAGVNEAGRTEVRLFDADTVIQTLPLDTIINIAVNRQIFVEVLPVGTDTVDVEVVVDVDDRNLVRSSGKIFPDDPWRFLYAFNRRFTSVIDVVI